MFKLSYPAFEYLHNLAWKSPLPVAKLLLSGLTATLMTIIIKKIN